MLPHYIFRVCGKEVVQPGGRKEKKFCSDKCRNKWWNSNLDKVNRKANYEFICPHCKKPFSAYGNKNRKYCSHQLQRTSKMEYVIEPTKTNAGTRVIPMTKEVTEMFRAIIQDRPEYKVEKVVGGYTGFLFLDKNGMPLVAMHWEHRFNSMVGRYNEIYKVQMPNITPHVCRHTYCSNMAKSGMNPKTLQYLMGHSDIAVTLNVYTHVGLEDAEKELQKMQGLENARKEMGISDTDDKPLKQNMFKVV